jgi:hypothetical protein
VARVRSQEPKKIDALWQCRMILALHRGKNDWADPQLGCDRIKG